MDTRQFASCAVCALVFLMMTPSAPAQQEIDLFGGSTSASSSADDSSPGGIQIEGAASSSSGAVVGRPGSGEMAVKFVRLGGTMYVPVMVQSRRVYFIFDTGASITTLTPKFARSAGISPPKGAPVLRFNTANGVTTMPLGLITRMRLGEHALQNVTYSTCKTCGAGKRPGLDAEVVGLLGMNVIRKYQVRVDEAEGLLVLSPNVSYTSQLEDVSPWLSPRFRGIKPGDGASVMVRNKAPKSIEVTLELSCGKRGVSRQTFRQKKRIPARKEVNVFFPLDKDTEECFKEDLGFEIVDGQW